jgi:hypothetical protein
VHEQKARHRRPKPPARTEPATRLQQWLDDHGFTSAQLERATGICRPTMSAIRKGRDVRKSTMLKILVGATALAGRVVTVEELFDFDPASPENVRLMAAA